MADDWRCVPAAAVSRPSHPVSAAPMAKVNLSDLMSLRRSLMSLASLMLLMVLTTGIAGLFAVWSLSGLHLRTEKTLNEAAATLDHARSVQANFKTQVQEWKNILLRGHVAQDRASHLKAFEARKLKTTELLQALPARLDRLEKMAGSDHESSAFRLPATINVPEQITALAQLNQAYDRALQAATAGDATASSPARSAGAISANNTNTAGSGCVCTDARAVRRLRGPLHRCKACNSAPMR